MDLMDVRPQTQNGKLQVQKVRGDVEFTNVRFA